MGSFCFVWYNILVSLVTKFGYLDFVKEISYDGYWSRTLSCQKNIEDNPKLLKIDNQL